MGSETVESEAVDNLVEVTRDVGIRQAEATEKLAAAMEKIADQPRKQTYFIGVLAMKTAMHRNVRVN